MRSFSVEYPHLPPSDNHIYEPKIMTVGTGVRRRTKTHIGYTKEASRYKEGFVRWVDEHHFGDVQLFAAGHRPVSVYLVEILLLFPLADVLNKGWLQKYTCDSSPGAAQQNRKGERKAKSPYKRLDTLNRRKLLEDGLAEALGVDDSLSWEANVVKAITGGEPRVVITLTEHTPLLFGIPPEYLED